MNIISFVKNKCFDLDIIDNKNIKEEFTTILEDCFKKFTYSNVSSSEDVEYISSECVYNVDSIDKMTILKILKKELEDRRIDIVDWDKSVKKFKLEYNDVPYVMRYIYDEKRNIHSICLNLEKQVGVMHRHFGPSYRIDYDATRSYLEFNKIELTDGEKLDVERHRYLLQGKNLTLVSYVKTYDALKLYVQECMIPLYENKYRDIYHDGKYLLDNVTKEESNYIYITDKLSSLPGKLTRGVIACNGLIVYENEENKMNYDGFITCYDSLMSNDMYKFKHMPLYLKEKELIKIYNNRRIMEERVRKLVKKDS